MAWFQRKKAGILTSRREQNDAPEGQWVKDPVTGEIINRRELEENLLVCPGSGHHFSMSSLGYFDLLFDEARYTLHDEELVSVDPLEFQDRKPYDQRLEQARAKTGLADAARAATGKVGRENRDGGDRP